MSTTAHDAMAEAVLLGNVIANPKVGGPALLALAADDFYVPRHKVIAGALTSMLMHDKPIDIATVLGELARRGALREGRDGTYVSDLFAKAWAPSHSPTLAVQIRDATRRRKTAEAALRLQQRADQLEASVEECLAGHEVDIAAIPPALDSMVREKPQTVAEMLAKRGEAPRFDWLIPGLLERTERVVCTGAEGAGKSELLTQVACAAAAGVHPFTGMPIEAERPRVLVLDFENSQGQADRRYERICDAIDDLGPPNKDWRDWIHFESHRAGKDIVRNDRPWWDAVCAATEPDLIVTGSAWKMGLGNPDKEVDVLPFLLVLDKTCFRHNSALIIEAHAGHATDTDTGKRKMRPSGTSAWLRWPEVGIGLRRSDKDLGEKRPNHVDLVTWRTPREERAWPRQLTVGYPGTLPWEPDDPNYMAMAGF